MKTVIFAVLKRFPFLASAKLWAIIALAGASLAVWFYIAGLHAELRAASSKSLSLAAEISLLQGKIEGQNAAILRLKSEKEAAEKRAEKRALVTLDASKKAQRADDLDPTNGPERMNNFIAGEFMR